MRQSFSFTLEGRDWSRLYLWYWVPTLALMALSMAQSLRPVSEDPNAVLASLLLSLAIMFLSMLLRSYFTVPILRTWLPRLSVDQKAFGFSGDSMAYVVLNVKGFLLSVVTLGIYLPWYLRNVIDYLARETTFEGASARFTGKPGRLLGIFFGFIGVTVVMTMVAIFGLVLVTPGFLTEGPSANLAMTGITFALVLLIVGPLMYLVYGWMVQLTWKDAQVRWTTRFFPASGMILGQTLLTVLSLGLWWPGALLVLYRYFVGRTVVEGQASGPLRLSFDGKLGEGFGLFWGQALLTLFSLGFYGAWSGPNVCRWLAAHTWVEPQAEPGPAGFISL